MWGRSRVAMSTRLRLAWSCESPWHVFASGCGPIGALMGPMRDMNETGLYRRQREPLSNIRACLSGLLSQPPGGSP